MSTFLLLTITGLGLGAMYFLIASGLSLIYGLMGVLNFAHGVFLTVTAYALWFTESKLGGVPVLPRFLIAALVGLVVGTVFAALVELVLIRPLYGRHIEQVLVTVGLALAVTALVTAIWGSDARVVAAPRLDRSHDDHLRRAHPERPLARDRDGGRRAVRPRGVPAPHALRADRPRRRREPGDGDRARDRRAQVVHAGLRDRRPRRGIAAVLYTLYSTTVDPQQGTSLVIFAFIVVVIGGLGSIRGTAWAAVIVGLVQQYANYYASSGLGDLSVVLLLGLVLIVRPRGLSGSFA